MRFEKKTCSILLPLFFFTSIISAQENLTTKIYLPDSLRHTSSLPFKKIALPIMLTGYGFAGLENDGIIRLDKSIREEIWVDRPHRGISVDDYMQYGPGMSVYVLNAVGVKGKNNFKDRTMIFLLSNAIMGAIVNPVKWATRLQRPDGFGTNAFPSGHTATAFTGAAFLDKEYSWRSPWYGVAGYLMATAVGALRIYNNRHWARDVVAGAGIGIFSTELAYWLYPKIKAARIFHRK